MMVLLRRAWRAFWAASSVLDRWKGAPVLALMLSLCAFDRIATNLSVTLSVAKQVKRINPDAKLYWGVAKNLAEGNGFEDTVRNFEILPTVGHPGLMALAWSQFGWTPAQYTLFTTWLASALLIWAVYRYSRSVLTTVAALLLVREMLLGVRWLAGNVESSVMLATAVLVAALVELYRQPRWLPWGILAGLAMALHLLVRPVFLFPVHLLTLLGIALWLVPRWRERWLPSRRGAFGAVMVALLIAEGVVGGMRLYSEAEYGDSRLATGTYGAWPLYCANNPYVGPEEGDRKPKDEPGFMKRAKLVVPRYGGSIEIGWQARQRLLLNDVLAYWREEPLRAFRGWWWRLSRFTGFNEQVAESRQRAVHAGSLVTLLILTGAGFLSRRPRWGMGTVVLAIFFCYAGIHSLFVWAGLRYVYHLFPLLAVGILFAASDLLRPALARAPTHENDGEAASDVSLPPEPVGAILDDPQPHGF